MCSSDLAEPMLVLKDITLNAAPGEMVALIGSNGIGKSTLLRTLAGFQPSFGGRIEIGGSNLETLHPREVSRMISYVSTENIRIPNLSVFDLVAYGRFPYTNWIGMLSGEDRDIVSDAIQKVGLKGMEHRSVIQPCNWSACADPDRKRKGKCKP